MAAQRFALLALGRAWILFGSRKNSKPENCSKMPQNPQRPVHALLGGFLFQWIANLPKNYSYNYACYSQPNPEFGGEVESLSCIERQGV